MAEAESITFRPAVPSDAQVVAAIVNGAYRGDATGRGWTSEADFIAGPRIDDALPNKARGSGVRSSRGPRTTRGANLARASSRCTS